MLRLIKAKIFSYVALILFGLLSPSLILSASASTFSKNRENVNQLNFLDNGILASASSDENSKPTAIIAEEYCKFLNAVGASDPHHLYDESIELKALITRSGKPGYYTYIVTSEDQNKSALTIEPLSAMRYCNWLENSASTSITNFNCCEAATEHGVYELQGDNLVSINPDATYFIADDDGPLNLDSCYDNQLSSILNTFYVVNASVDLTEKNSGKGKTGTSLQKIEEGMIAVALLAGGEGERDEAPEQLMRERVSNVGTSGRGTDDFSSTSSSQYATEGPMMIGIKSASSSISLDTIRRVIEADPRAARLILKA